MGSRHDGWNTASFKKAMPNFEKNTDGGQRAGDIFSLVTEFKQGE